MSYADVGQSERTAAGSTTYASSPLGLQISSSSGSNTFFLRDGKGNLLGQRLPDSSHWYFLKDGLGSIVAVINGSGSSVANRYGYDPYGKITASTGTQANSWGYAGGYRDATGLVKFGTRYYDANLGRWTQRDVLAGIPDTSEANPYNYVGCNPVNAIDPTGKWAVNPTPGQWGYCALGFGLATIGLIGGVALFASGVGEFIGAGEFAAEGIWGLIGGWVGGLSGMKMGSAVLGAGAAAALYLIPDNCPPLVVNAQ